MSLVLFGVMQKVVTRVVLVGLLVVTVKSVTPCFTDMWNLVDRLIMIDSLYW